MLNVRNIPIEEIKAYENNPRRIGDNAVNAVAESIKAFGFKVPVILDSENVIVTGHTRILAAKKLGLQEVPCVVADDLTPEQAKALRLADNKTGELSGWDFEKLDLELEELADFDIDMSEFGFEVKDEVDINSFFETSHEQTEDKKKKTVICPECGAEIEI